MTENNTGHGDGRTRRTVLRTIGGIASVAAAGAGTTTAAATSTGDGAFTTTDFEIESFDGTMLGTTLFEPADDGPHPAMLMTHGYGLNRSLSPFVRTRAKMYARNGYTTLTYDSRGFGDSGGIVNVNGPKEVKDAQTLITWLAGRDTVLTDGPDDPRIGMDGTSYGGGIQLNTAAAEGRGEGVPESGDRLDALVPRWAWHDLTYSLAPNGVVKRNWALLLTLGGAVGSHLTGDDPMDYIEGQSPTLYEILVEGFARNELTDDAKTYLDARSPSQDIADITAPALFIQAWPDTLFIPNETIWNAEGLEGTDHRCIFSNGGHSLELLASLRQQEYLNAKALEWIDTHLRENGQSSLPPVTFYEMQTGEWRTADGIPPSSATRETLSLASVREGEETPVFNSVIPTATSQLFPVNADTSVTSIDFDFPIAEETELMGSPTLRLAVEPLGPETRLFGRFYRIDSAGDAELIDNQVTPFKVDGEPGTIESVTCEAVAFQRRFKPGETLRFTIATTDAGFQSSRTSAGARIHHSAAHPSTIDVPVVGNDGFADRAEDNEFGGFLFD
jgi:ABC-2 type transport system ATP-binding protein